VTVTFAGPVLDRTGMLVDFAVAEAKLREVLGRQLHTDLNHCPAMKDLNPSAEHVAKVVYEQIAENTALRGTLHRVRVTEAPGCAATYIGQRSHLGQRPEP
jgi:6-pyruvoyltetrahydropterin/6-carboxytetrahydropterin synthase